MFMFKCEFCCWMCVKGSFIHFLPCAAVQDKLNGKWSREIDCLPWATDKIIYSSVHLAKPNTNISPPLLQSFLSKLILSYYIMLNKNLFILNTFFSVLRVLFKDVQQKFVENTDCYISKSLSKHICSFLNQLIQHW